MAERRLGDEPIKVAFAGRKETIRINKPVTQSSIVIGGGGLSRENPDYYAALVANYILGGRAHLAFNGRYQDKKRARVLGR